MPQTILPSLVPTHTVGGKACDRWEGSTSTKQEGSGVAEPVPRAPVPFWSKTVPFADSETGAPRLKTVPLD